MSTPWAIIVFVISLIFLIFIHELGHFLAAKWRGVTVQEFGMGIPPRIFAFRRGETEYSINALPIGGFCKLLGEEDPSEPGSLASKSVSTRILVLSAGSLMMFIFPVVLFSFINMIPHDVIVDYKDVGVGAIVEEAPAHLAGVEVGDQLLSMNGMPVSTMEDVRGITDDNLGVPITMVVLRDDQEIELSMVPREEWPENQGPLGITMIGVTPIKEKTEFNPPWEAIGMGFKDTWGMVTALKDGITLAIRGEADFGVTGVIGMGQVTTELARDGGILVLLGWTAFLSLNLGIINLLPIPALDGSRIAFIVLEVIRRGKRVSPKTEGMIHLVGFIMLVGMIFIIGYYDILRIAAGESLISNP